MFNNCTKGGILTLDCIVPFYRLALGLALDFVGIVSLILIIVAGIRFITSGGGKEVEAAKNMLTYAIVGLVVVLLAYFIVSLIAGVTGVRCILFFGATSC